jgi:hypothetical protein
MHPAAQSDSIRFARFATIHKHNWRPYFTKPWYLVSHFPHTRSPKKNALGARIPKGANLSWPLMSNFPVELAPRGKDLDSHGTLNFFNWRVVTPKPLGATPSQTEVCMLGFCYFLDVVSGYRPKIETCFAPCPASVMCFCLWATLQFKKLKNLVLSAWCLIHKSVPSRLLVSRPAP